MSKNSVRKIKGPDRLAGEAVEQAEERGALFWKLLVFTLPICYMIYFSATTILDYQNFVMSAFDIGIHAQATWKIAFGRGLFNTIRGLNIWGDHLWLIMPLFAPAYWIAPRAETLLVIQATALGAAAYPLANFALRRSGSWCVAAIAVFAWVFCPALQNMNLEQFHPEVIATPFLLLAIDRADARSWKWYWAAICLALLCKEDIALTVFAFGIWVAIAKDKRVGIATLLLSSVWFVVSMKILLPAFNGSGFFRFRGGYWFAGLWAEKFNILYYLESLASWKAGIYLAQLFVPLALFSFFDPLLLLGALPSLIINLLSKNDYLISIHYHYNNQTLPFIYAAAISVLSAAYRSKPKARFWLFISCVGASLISNAAFGDAPVTRLASRLTNQIKQREESLTWPAVSAIEELLPADPSVGISASHNLVPMLSNRDKIYMFPVPFAASYWGIDGENFPDSTSADYIVLDLNQNYDGAEQVPVQQLFLEHFERVKQVANFLLVRRKSEPTLPALLQNAAGSVPLGSIQLNAYVIPGMEVRGMYLLFDQAPTAQLLTKELRLADNPGDIVSVEGERLGAADNLRATFRGRWLAQGEKDIILRLSVDDGARVYIDGVRRLDSAVASAFGELLTSDPFRLSPGEHEIMVDYFEWGGPAHLLIEWAAVGEGFKPLKASDVLP